MSTLSGGFSSVPFPVPVSLLPVPFLSLTLAPAFLSDSPSFSPPLQMQHVPPTAVASQPCFEPTTQALCNVGWGEAAPLWGGTRAEHWAWGTYTQRFEGPGKILSLGWGAGGRASLAQELEKETWA